MSKEAMKLALEALENSVDLVREDAYQAEKLYGNYPARQGKVNGLKVLADDHEKAITALQKALANEALDKMAENARELGLDYEPAQQKPVAVWELFEDGWDSIADPEWMETLPVGTKLYTSPPAQRTGIGLTHEEIEQGCKESWVTEQAWQSAVWWAEAKLKEKNNG